MLIQFTQIDYDRDIAFVAIEQPTGDLAGIVRYASTPDRDSAEFGILVRSDLKRKGLGRMLMETLIDYAKRQGIGELRGRVLRDNSRMLDLAAKLGFDQVDGTEQETVQIILPLRG